MQAAASEKAQSPLCFVCNKKAECKNGEIPRNCADYIITSLSSRLSEV
jgi:hypothetical protein